MTSVKLKLPYGEVVECEVVDRYNDTFYVVYHDPKTKARWSNWCDKSSLIFPSFSELII